MDRRAPLWLSEADTGRTTAYSSPESAGTDRPASGIPKEGERKTWPSAEWTEGCRLTAYLRASRWTNVGPPEPQRRDGRDRFVCSPGLASPSRGRRIRSDSDDNHSRRFRFSLQKALQVTGIARQNQRRYGLERFGRNDRVDRIGCAGLRLQLSGTACNKRRCGQQGVNHVDDPVDVSPIMAAAMNLGKNRRRNEDDVPLADCAVQGGPGICASTGQCQYSARIQDQAPRPGKRLYRGHSCPSIRRRASSGMGPNSSAISASSSSSRARWSRMASDSLRNREKPRLPTRAFASATFAASRVVETFTVVMATILPRVGPSSSTH